MEKYFTGNKGRVGEKRKNAREKLKNVGRGELKFYKKWKSNTLGRLRTYHEKDGKIWKNLEKLKGARKKL